METDMDINDTIEEINKIVRQHDPDGNELKSVMKTGRAISKKLNEFYWFWWTRFPAKFAACRTDSDLFQTIDEINEWVNNTRRMFKLDEE